MPPHPAPKNSKQALEISRNNHEHLNTGNTTKNFSTHHLRWPDSWHHWSPCLLTHDCTHASPPDDHEPTRVHRCVPNTNQRGRKCRCRGMNVNSPSCGPSFLLLTPPLPAQCFVFVSHINKFLSPSYACTCVHYLANDDGTIGTHMSTRVRALVTYHHTIMILNITTRIHIPAEGNTNTNKTNKQTKNDT
jgi:hypothetical protein